MYVYFKFRNTDAVGHERLHVWCVQCNVKTFDGVKMQFVTNHEHGTNVGSRLYVMDTNDEYQLFKLKNREFSFEVDVSERECGMNGQVMPTATAPPDLLLTPTKLTGHHFVGKEV